ncbi:MAG: hypothetical protein IJ568_07575 [Bacilli bacterium]|nr:hypothetical protein [Bacilli bacterium]
MANNKGRYFLKRENIYKEEIEFFNFKTMDFEDKRNEGVMLSTIDSMTTLFSDGDELERYLSKDTRKEHMYKYIIVYRNNKNEEERELNPVWDDMKLNAISKISDGKINYDNNIMIELAEEIFDEIKKPNSLLARKIVKAKKNDLKLDDYNKKLVGALASSKRSPFIGDLTEAFSSYKEFRALYLNYKENQNKKDDWKEILRKLR